MSKPIQIGSSSQFNKILADSKIVVADFYADWCGPCKQIAPIYERLAGQLSRPNKITFVKVNTDAQKEVAQKYQVSALPTFIVFKNKQVVEQIQGANPGKLNDIVMKLAAEAGSDSTNGFGEGGGSDGSTWTAFPAPKGYFDVTDEIETKGLDLLNSDGQYGTSRDLFNPSEPSSLLTGKKAGDAKKDWVESDTDEQLMLFVPFMSTMKVHSLHITSLPPKGDGDAPMRPRTLKIYANRANILGFEEAEDVVATQEVSLNERDWDEKTGTARVELRFVKFQNVKSLVLFVVDGDGDGEKVRIDRLRFLGETGEKRDQGKLEKVGED